MLWGSKDFSQLNPVVMYWVRHKNLSMEQEAGMIADDYIRDRGWMDSTGKGKSEASSSKWRQYGGSKEERRDNDQRIPMKPEEEGRWSGENRRDKVPKHSEHNKGPQCYSCRERGYISAKCPMKVLLVETADGEADEYVAQGEVEVVLCSHIKLDTGADKTIVRADLDHKHLTMERRYLKGFDGDIKERPLARVRMRVEGHDIEKTAAVQMDDGHARRCTAGQRIRSPTLTTQGSTSGGGWSKRTTQISVLS